MKEQIKQKELAIDVKTINGIISSSSFLTSRDAERLTSDLILQRAILIGAMTVEEAKDCVKKNLETPKLEEHKCNEY